MTAAPRGRTPARRSPAPGRPARGLRPVHSLTRAAGGRTAQGRAEDEAREQQPQQPQVPRGGRRDRRRHPSAPPPGQHGTARPGAGHGLRAPRRGRRRRRRRRGRRRKRRQRPRRRRMRKRGGGGADAAAKDPGRRLGSERRACRECACALHLRGRDDAVRLRPLSLPPVLFPLPPTQPASPPGASTTAACAAGDVL